MSGHPLASAREEWERVLEDAATTAAEYRDAGWETLELHPGDVTPDPPAWEPNPDGGRVGFDVLVPDDEFERLEAAVADADFTEYEAYTGRTGEVVFAVVVMRAEDAGRAVFLPLYYAIPQVEALVPRALEAGAVETEVRPLSDERRVTLTQSDPSPLFPTAGGDEGAAADADTDADTDTDTDAADAYEAEAGDGNDGDVD